MRTAGIRASADALLRTASALLSEWMLSHGEREEIGVLHARVVDAFASARDAKSAEALVRLEKESLRPIAQLLRHYARRHHLQLVRCPWPPVLADPNACTVVAGSGQSELLAAAEQAALRPCMPEAGQPPDLDLWRRIAGSELLLVDIRESERCTHWPRICYAVGLALAIGRVVVVTHDGGVVLPFDMHLIALNRDASERSLPETIAAALCHVPSAVRDPAAVLAAARHAVAADPPTSAWARRTADRIGKQLGNVEVDPIEMRRAIDAHLSRVGGPFRVELSSFRPAYPPQEAIRCFHVLPFSLPEWVTNAVREACEPTIEYLRGDTDKDLQILDRIWTGVGESSLIVTDLTGLNPNVCLELGVARTLGRPLLLCHERASWTGKQLFPEISRLSVGLYAGAPDLTALVRAELGAIQTGGGCGLR